MPSQKKIDIVEKLKDKASRAKALVFADYQGLTHKQLEELKKAVKNADADLVVTKNTLLKRALQNTQETQQTRKSDNLTIRNTGISGTPSLSEFSGPTATLFAYGDILAPLREIAKSIRLLKLPTIKFGIIDDKQIPADDIIRLATLPSREVLIAQVIGGIKAPINGLHRALNWNLQRLVLTLKSIENVKQK